MVVELFAMERTHHEEIVGTGAKVGEEIIIEARGLKAGRTMVFLECEIRNKDQALLVKGSHTKYIG